MLTPCPDAALPRGFHTTRWSVIRQAIADDDKQSREALEQICRAYWYPLYAFVRRSGHSREDSQDLVQGFFLKLLNKHLLGVANPDKGKLRTFLLTCLRRYLLDERDRAMAQKREGNRGVSSSLALDTDWAEQRYAEEPVDHLTPDRLFQRRWALTVLELTLQLLGEEYERRDKRQLFVTLRPFLGFKADPTALPSCEAVAKQLGMPEATVRSHIFRLRQRWSELMFEQVAATLGEDSSQAVKDELKELLECV